MTNSFTIRTTQKTAPAIPPSINATITKERCRNNMMAKKISNKHFNVTENNWAIESRSLHRKITILRKKGERIRNNNVILKSIHRIAFVHAAQIDKFTCLKDFQIIRGARVWHAKKFDVVQVVGARHSSFRKVKLAIRQVNLQIKAEMLSTQDNKEEKMRMRSMCVQAHVNSYGTRTAPSMSEHADLKFEM